MHISLRTHQSLFQN